MYSRENYLLAKAEIEARRVAAINTAEERNRELALISDEIRALDTELRGTGLALFRAACTGADIEPIRERNRFLMEKRGDVLAALGYPRDYTEVHYTCGECSDTGFVGTKMCTCLKELLIKKNIESSGMGKLMDKQSFDNFKLDYYKDSAEDYERMSKNLEAARSFADNFARDRGNLLLIGTTGTGKTHLSTAIAKEIIHQGFDVLYDSVQNIVGDFETDRFKSGYGPHENIADKYLECDLLIVDDLGTEFINQFSISCLYNLLNTRHNRGLSTVISTNLSAKELAGKYDGRIYSRIIGCDYKVLLFSGKDRRIFKQ